jgi:hypothetical protein
MEDQVKEQVVESKMNPEDFISFDFTKQELGIILECLNIADKQVSTIGMQNKGTKLALLNLSGKIEEKLINKEDDIQR